MAPSKLRLNQDLEDDVGRRPGHEREEPSGITLVRAIPAQPSKAAQLYMTYTNNREAKRYVDNDASTIKEFSTIDEPSHSTFLNEPKPLAPMAQP